MKLKEIKAGQLFYESACGMNIECVAMTDAWVSGEIEGKVQYSLRSRNTQTGQDVTHMVTEGLGHYGPSLYAFPAYIRNAGSHGPQDALLVGARAPIDLDDPVQVELRRPEILEAYASADLHLSLEDFAHQIEAAPVETMDPTS